MVLMFNLFSTDNSADVSGSVLYGVVIDKCKLIDLDTYSSGEVFDKIVHIEDNTTSRQSVSSVPFHICPCNCNNSSASNYTAAILW